MQRFNSPEDPEYIRIVDDIRRFIVLLEGGVQITELSPNPYFHGRESMIFQKHGALNSLDYSVLQILRYDAPISNFKPLENTLLISFCL